MPSIIHHTSQIVPVPDKKLVVLATFGAVCFLCILSFASAQSQMPHYRSYSTTHYGSTTHVHKVDQKPHSVPSAVMPGVIGKSSARGATSPSKELDQLERASVVKPMGTRRAASPALAKRTITPEQHSAPINFSHKELPQSPHSGAVKIH